MNNRRIFLTLLLAITFILACNLPQAPKTPVPTYTPIIMSPTPVSQAEALSTMVSGTATQAAAATKTQLALPYGEIKVDIIWFSDNQALAVNVTSSAPAGYEARKVYAWLFNANGVSFLTGQGSSFQLIQQVTNQNLTLKVGTEMEIYSVMELPGYGEYHYVIQVNYP